MKKNSKIILIIVLILAIGFASVSTVLKLGGTTKVGFNEEDFVSNIIFTRSVLDDEDISDTTIIEEGKKIKFVTKKLTTVGESTVLDYTVTNKSKQYAARGYVKTFEYDPEYIKIENGPSNYDLLPDSSEDGEMVITLIKPLIEDKDVEVTIEIEFGPIDKEDVTTTTTTTTTTTSTTTTEVAGEKYDLTIDPDGGIYNGSNEIINRKVLKDTEVTLNEITKEGYIFSHWQVNETDKLDGNTITITQNTTIKAIWINTDDIVAKIDDEYYNSVQSAFNAAKTNDEIILLKDTEETSTNKKEVVLNLDSHKITGSITNDGKLRIDNGEIENTNGAAIINNGTLTLGNNEGTISTEAPSIIGDSIGIEQKGTLNFYDGYVEGVVGINGDVANTPEEYYVFVDHNDIKNCQKVYLVKEVTRAVVKTTTNGEVYYYNLQDAINKSLISSYPIYAMRDFESAYTLSITNNKPILFDIIGYTVNLGNTITNSGSLTLTNSVTESGTLTTSFPIVNNNNLSLSNIKISSTTTENAIENNKKLAINKSTITAKNGYALKTNSSNVTIDSTSTLESNKRALYVNTKGLMVSTGNIGGADISSSGELIVAGATIRSKTGPSIINNGKLEVRSGNVYSQPYERGINSTGNNNRVDIKGGYISELYISSGTLNISGGEFHLRSECAVNALSSSVTISGGTFDGSLATALYFSGSTANVTNATISDGDNGVLINNSDVTINNITINNNWTDIGIVMNSGNLSISDANINVDEYAIKQSGGTISYGSETSFSIASPLIMADMYGVYKTGGIFNFYSGKIAGKTGAISGTYDNYPSMMTSEETTETINDSEYKVNTLTELKDFIELVETGAVYSSFVNAISDISTEGTLLLKTSASITENIDIPSNKKITIDTNGYKTNLSKMITNNGQLTIKSSAQKFGEIISSIDTMITNNATLILESNSFLNSKGTVLINNGSEAKTTINSGIYQGQLYVVKVDNSSLEINDGQFIIDYNNYYGTMPSDSSAIYINSGKVIINNGYFSAFTKTAATKTKTIYINSSELTINGGVFEKSYYGIYINTTASEININGGSISATSNAINQGYCSAGNYAKVFVTSGMIEGGSSGIYGGEINVVGGTIKGRGLYGITGNTIIIGENDIEVKDKPIIYGRTAIYATTPHYYYDGILYGIEKVVNTPFTNTASGYRIENSEETIDNINYKKYELKENGAYLKIGDNLFNSFDKAIDSVQENETIQVVGNALVSERPIIPTDKSFTLDLNGYTIQLTIPITNNGTLIIDDSSEDKSGTLYSSEVGAVVDNFGTLTLENGNIIKDSTDSTAYGINSKGNLTINGGKISSKKTGVHVYSSSTNTTTINGGIIENCDIGLYLYTATTINNVTITNCRVGIYTLGSPTININDGAISATESGIVSEKYNIRLRGGSIYGEKQGVKGYIYIYAGRIEGNLYGVLGGVYAYGGEVVGGEYGVRGSATLGTSSANLSDGATIIGNLYGIYGGTIKWYNGTVKGKTGVDNSQITGIREGYKLGEDTEIINGEEYVVNRLVVGDPVIYNGDIGYSIASDAFKNAQSGDTLKLVGDIVSSYQISNQSSNTLTIDLNGHTYLTSAMIYNYGTLYIKDTSDEKQSLLKFSNSNYISNISGGKLYIDDVDITTVGKKVAAIENGGNSTINNSQITGGYAIKNSGILYLNNSILSMTGSYTYGLMNEKKAFIDGGKIEFKSGGTGTLIYQNKSNTNITVENAHIDGLASLDDDHGIELNYGTAPIFRNNTIETRIKLGSNVGKTVIEGNTISRGGTSSFSTSGNDALSAVYSETTLDFINNTITVTNPNANHNRSVKYGVYSKKDITAVGNTINFINETDEKININIAIYNNGKTATIDNNRIDISNANTATGILVSATTQQTNLNSNHISINNSLYGRGIYNNGKIDIGHIENKTKNIIELDNNTTAYGIYMNNGALKLNDNNADTDIFVRNSDKGYGIYNKAGTFELLSNNAQTNIKAYDSKEAYGIYISGGSVTLGEKDSSSNSGTTDADINYQTPLISALGTTSGIGVKKNSGTFNFYDGKVIGNTNSIPDTVTDTEYYYEVIRRKDEQNGYEYSILEYLA